MGEPERPSGDDALGRAASSSPRWSRAEQGLRSLAARLCRVFPQPMLGLCLGTLALLCLATAWRENVAALGSLFDLTDLGLAVVLAVGAVLAQLHHVHISRGFKISILTVPLYLLAAMTPPPLAATSAGIALLIGEFAQRSVKGQYPSDTASTTGRWIILVYMGSLLAHLPAPHPAPLMVAGLALPLAAPLTRLPLLAAALLMFLGDMLTVSLEIGAITGEAPHRILRMTLREGAPAEAPQYLVAFLGALAADQDAWTVVLLIIPAVLLRRLLKRGMEMHDETRTLLESMADAVDLRDAYTGGHSRRVTDYTRAILAALGLSGPEVELITAAARVHDIGKIAIPDGILNKPDRLTDEERAIMESHPQRGAEFLDRYRDFQRGITIVLYHHERVDGLGYPHGLRGADIPFGARVIAVADSFDAMTSDRPYRKGMPVAKAARILAEGRGTQWDEQIVDAFIDHVMPTLRLESQDPTSGTDAAKTPALAPPQPAGAVPAVTASISLPAAQTPVMDAVA